MENKKSDKALFWWNELPKTVKSILRDQHSLRIDYFHYTEKEKIMELYRVEVEENRGIINMFNKLIPKPN